MKKLLTIAAATAVLGAGVYAQPAQALQTGICFDHKDQESDLSICIESMAFKPSGFDVFKIRGFQQGIGLINEEMKVQCKNSSVTSWNSSGNLNEPDAAEIAKDFCLGRETTGR